jgi:hypothetical protein
MRRKFYMFLISSVCGMFLFLYQMKQSQKGGVVETSSQLSTAQSTNYAYCLSQGCKPEQCLPAAQDGIECSGWEEYERCMEGKGYAPPCADYVEEDMKECRELAKDCIPESGNRGGRGRRKRE